MLISDHRCDVRIGTADLGCRIVAPYWYVCHMHIVSLHAVRDVHYDVETVYDISMLDSITHPRYKEGGRQSRGQQLVAHFYLRVP